MPVYVSICAHTCMKTSMCMYVFYLLDHPPSCDCKSSLPLWDPNWFNKKKSCIPFLLDLASRLTL